MTKHHHLIFVIHHQFFSPCMHKIVIFLTGSWAPGIIRVCHHAWVKCSILTSLYGPVICVPLVTVFLRALLSPLSYVRGVIVMIQQPPNNCRGNIETKKKTFGGIRWGKRGRAWVDRAVELETRKVKGLLGLQLCPRKMVTSCSSFHHHSKTRYPPITNLNTTWLWDRDPLLVTAEPEARWLQSCYMYKKRIPYMQIIIQSLD
jgi:hypothetical protein